MTTHLCTGGTSAAKNLPRAPRFDSEWAALRGGIESASIAIYDSFSGYSMGDAAALQRSLSAEIHSLARM